jgi:hypothetical protein
VEGGRDEHGEPRKETYDHGDLLFLEIHPSRACGFAKTIDFSANQIEEPNVRRSATRCAALILAASGALGHA